MDVRLDGQVVLLTGGSRNIGAAAAQLFAEAGADLVLCARGEEELDSVANRLRRTTGRDVLAMPANLAKADDVERLADAALERFGRVDVLVNNAFYNPSSVGSGFFDVTAKQWQVSFDVNVRAPFDLARRLVPGMLDRGRGSIVNVLSTVCFSVIPPNTPYAASKAGLWQVTRYLAAEFAPAVRVNAVCPGTTPYGEDDSRTDWAALLALVPMARKGTAFDSAAAIVYLASDAASYTTGQVLFAEGGRATLRAIPAA